MGISLADRASGWRCHRPHRRRQIFLRFELELRPIHILYGLSASRWLMKAKTYDDFILPGLTNSPIQRWHRIARWREGDRLICLAAIIAGPARSGSGWIVTRSP